MRLYSELAVLQLFPFGPNHGACVKLRPVIARSQRKSTVLWRKVATSATRIAYKTGTELRGSFRSKSEVRVRRSGFKVWKCDRARETVQKAPLGLPERTTNYDKFE
jgi:hypothetical protein